MMNSTPPPRRRWKWHQLDRVVAPMLPGCGAKCKRQCSAKVPDEKRVAIWTEFSAFDGVDAPAKRQEYLLAGITVKRPFCKRRPTTGRTITIQFRLAGVQVCKPMFLQTFGYKNDRAVKNAIRDLVQRAADEDHVSQLTEEANSLPEQYIHTVKVDPPLGSSPKKCHTKGADRRLTNEKCPNDSAIGRESPSLLCSPSTSAPIKSEPLSVGDELVNNIALVPMSPTPSVDAQLERELARMSTALFGTDANAVDRLHLAQSVFASLLGSACSLADAYRSLQRRISEVDHTSSFPVLVREILDDDEEDDAVVGQVPADTDGAIVENTTRNDELSALFAEMRAKAAAKKARPKKLSCPHCDKRFAMANKRNAHIKIAHQSNYRCDVCDRAFGFPSLLEYHRVTHMKVKPYKCEYCERMFGSEKSRAAHQKHICANRPTANGPKPHLCEQCGKAFASVQSLRMHGYTHIRLPPVVHECEHCGKVLRSRNSIREHRNKHAGRTFVCDCCGSSFRSASYFTQHRRTCTGVYRRPRKALIGSTASL